MVCDVVVGMMTTRVSTGMTMVCASDVAATVCVGEVAMIMTV